MRRAIQAGQFSDTEAYQLVLADESGLLPWEEGYDERLRPLQAPLWLPPEDEDA